jgi:hypothetical protein
MRTVSYPDLLKVLRQDWIEEDIGDALVFRPRPQP